MGWKPSISNKSMVTHWLYQNIYTLIIFAFSALFHADDERYLGIHADDFWIRADFFHEVSC